MNGCIYDPLIGRFMSADPYIPNPYNLQSFNRYSYAYNKPLVLWDPNGHEPWGTSYGGGNTQYTDTGNGTAANTYTGDSYGTNSDYSSSPSSYGNGVSAHSIAGVEGGGATAIAVYSNKDGTWELTNYGKTFGEQSKRNLEVLEVALDSRSYLEMGVKKSVKVPTINELAETGFALALKRPIVKTPTPVAPLNVVKGRPEGLPANYDKLPAQKDGSTKWGEPGDKHNYVRERPDGTLTQVKDGNVLDVNGNRIPGGNKTPEAHYDRVLFKFRE